MAQSVHLCVVHAWIPQALCAEQTKSLSACMQLLTHLTTHKMLFSLLLLSLHWITATQVQSRANGFCLLTLISHKSGSSNSLVSGAAAMISFVNPDLLGSLSTFKRVFAEPISRSRERDSTAEEQALGTERSKYAPEPPHCLLALPLSPLPVGGQPRRGSCP